MLVGAVKEIKPQENRVGLTPAGARVLRDAGAGVIVEAGAGVGSGIPDAEYSAAGVDGAADVWGRSDLIVKVKEPLEGEYGCLRPGLLLYTYLHLAPSPELTQVLIDKKVTAIAYEMIEEPDGRGDHRWRHRGP